MIILQSCARVWVPDVRAHLPEVQKEIEALTEKCGGCTRIAARGEWFGVGGGYVNEPVYIYEWWGDEVPVIQQLILALLRAGEESVMVQVDGTAVLMFPQDYDLTTEEDQE